MSFRPRVVVLLIVLLGPALVALGWAAWDRTSTTEKKDESDLLLYCAAGMRYPVEVVVKQYADEYGIDVKVQYGGSNTLLSQIEVAKMGDLYIAADDSYIQMAREKGLAAEAIPLATMRPVIAVAKGNPKGIEGIDDLLRSDIVTALGNPDQAAIGKKTRKLLRESKQWDRLEPLVKERGVFKPTVNEIANDVKIGSVDAGIVWDTTAAQYPDLEAIRTPELDAGTALIEVCVLNSTEDPTAALRFARYLSARDKGLKAFDEKHFEVVEGDEWAEKPEMTFFIGSVNRRAIEPVIERFSQREGVEINTVYNGCGILTGQMKTMRDQKLTGFPDTYMACDVYYLNNVRDMFQDAHEVSDTEIVIAVPKGNPKNIHSLQDLTRRDENGKPAIRVAVGIPSQCTIGALTHNLLQQEGVEDELMGTPENKGAVVVETASSALLIPAVTTGSADAALAYRTDTLAEADKIDAIRLDSDARRAVQPFAIARSSKYKYLSRRLYDAVSKARTDFEKAGFHFRDGDVPAPPAQAPSLAHP